MPVASPDLEIWAYWGGNAIGDGGPISTIISAQVIMTELGQFSSSTVVLPGANRRVILSMREYTYIEIMQTGIAGAIFAGYVITPTQQITENDDHTITLTIWPITEELKWKRTRRWIATNWLSIIASRIPALQTGWTGKFTGDITASTGGDMIVSVTLNNPTLLAAYIDIAKQFANYVRLGVDANGAPIRVLEMGQFNAPATITLTSVNGGDIDGLRENGTIRLISQIDRSPNDVKDLFNVAVPFGGGSDEASLVTLERLWRIMNDPRYINFGRWGTNAESLARTGLPTLFSEYDPNYPISDPENPPTGSVTWGFEDIYGNPLTGPYNVVVGARAADGTVPLYAYDPVTGAYLPNVMPILDQGAVGTRGTSLNGSRDYIVYDKLSYFGDPSNPTAHPAYGHKETVDYIDSGLNYADNTPANQELTEIALYLSIIAEFKHKAHPKETFTCVTDAISRPPRAGDLINIDFQRVGGDADGAIVEFDEYKDLRVLSVTRSFPDMKDTYVVSNTGRFDEDDSTVAADQGAQIIALQRRQDTGIAPYPMSFGRNVDALHPLHVYVIIPDGLFRWHRFIVRCDFLPFTATSTTADNQTQDFSIITPPQDILLDTPSGINLAGGFDPTGAQLAGPTDGFDYIKPETDRTAAVQLIVKNYGSILPAGQNLQAELRNASTPDQHYELTSQGVPTGSSVAANIRINFTKAITANVARLSLAQNVVKKFGTVARIAGTTIIATLPKHKHPLDQKIPDGPTAASCRMAINGQEVSSGVQLDSGGRNPDGSFPGSFQLSDISQFMQLPNTTVDLSFAPGTSSNNPYGAGYFQVTILGYGEFGGLASVGQIA